LDAFGVFADARHYAIGQFQRAAPGWAIHHRRFAGSYGVEESSQLGAQRLFGSRRQVLTEST
jgi:hypothetical protein